MAEEIKEHQPDLYRLFFEKAGDMIAIHDRDGRLIEVNPRFCAVTGRTRAEALALNAAYFVLPERLALYRKNIAGVFKNGFGVWEGKVRIADGSYLDIDCHAVRFDYHGRPASFNILYDISNFKKTEKALRQSEEKLKRAEVLYRSIFENAGTAMLMFGADGIITLINEEAEELSGYSRAEVQGKKYWQDFVHEDDLSRLSEYNQLRQKDNTAAPRRYEFRLINKKKERRYVLITIEFIPGLNMFIASLQDVTKQKLAELVLTQDKESVERLVAEKSKALIEAREELGRARRLSDLGLMAATIAHELRNPLNVISAAVYNIRQKKHDVALNVHLKNIESNVYESDRIISNLLSFSRIKMPKYEKVQVYDLLKDCVGAAEKRFDRKKGYVKIKFHRRENKKAIQADPHQLKSVFNNVLDNAFQSMPKRKDRLAVSAGFTGKNTLTIRISDNGEGIEKADLEKVFDPFFTTRAKGTGLGLTHCKELIRLHGGRIEIESEKGKGTVVLMTLPVERKLPRALKVRGGKKSIKSGISQFTKSPQ
ncbi:MAG: PAS domain S-box protein [Candidatus Margulisbacteria bacterium]|nr:PAS domain S-box protein [Candidatus Margulisiibacteriota bacterium]